MKKNRAKPGFERPMKSVFRGAGIPAFAPQGEDSQSEDERAHDGDLEESGFGLHGHSLRSIDVKIITPPPDTSKARMLSQSRLPSNKTPTEQQIMVILYHIKKLV